MTAPRRIRTYTAPEHKPRSQLTYSGYLTREQWDEVARRFPLSTIEPASFGFRLEPLSWRERLRRWLIWR